MYVCMYVYIYIGGWQVHRACRGKPPDSRASAKVCSEQVL